LVFSSRKLRRGDPHTSTIYGGADPELEKHHGMYRCVTFTFIGKVSKAPLFCSGGT